MPQNINEFQAKILPPLKEIRKLLVLLLLRDSTEVKHWFEVSQKFKEAYNLIDIRWKVSVLRGDKIRWKLKTCGSTAKYVEQAIV